MSLILDVRLDGYPQPVGTMARDDQDAIAFAYQPDYLARRDAIALSVSLPLDDAGFGDLLTRAYFDNLLQERDSARADVIARYGLANDDIAGILFHLGKDCAGAVSVLPEGAPPTKAPGDLAADYRPLSPARLAAIVTALHERQPLPEDIRDPSPLAGVQSKIALTRLPDGTLAEPNPGSGAPTTHILKVPDRRHRRDSEHEFAAMELSRQFGFPTAPVELLRIEELDVLLVERFDRTRDAQGRIVRRHQEDFCQALGLPSRLKYERNGQPPRIFDAKAVGRLLGQTVEPATERLRFVRATLFDILIGNVDGHAKNFSLFHQPSRALLSTPRYDVMPTMLDRDTTNEFAYRIGGAEQLAELNWDHLDAFLAALGFGSPTGRLRLLRSNIPPIIAQLDNALDGFGANGFKNFADLIATNLRTFCARLDLPVPPQAAGRDTFVR